MSPRAFPVTSLAPFVLAFVWPSGLGCSDSGRAGDTADTADTSAPDTTDTAEDTGALDDTSDTSDTGAPDTTAPDDTAAPADTTAPEDTTPAFVCTERAAVVPTAGFFADISRTSGIQVDNYLRDSPIKVPINDHSRLAFADLDGDGFDDIVAHSLFPNPQAGVPFEHLVFLNNGDGTFRDHSTASGLRDVQAGFFAFGDMDNDGDLDCFAGLDAEDIPGGAHGVFLNDGTARFTAVDNPGIALPRVPPAVGNAAFGDYDNDAILDVYLGVGQTTYAGRDYLFKGNGDGTFVDISNRLLGNKVVQSNGSVTCDFDNDGDLDIVVSTYGVSVGNGHNLLWQNDGAANFRDVARDKGYAAQSTGNYWLASTGNGRDDEPVDPEDFVGDNGFGVDCDDLDNDGLMDIFQTAISHPVSSDYSRKWSDPSQVLYNLGPDAEHRFENRFLDKGLPFNEGDVDGAVVDFDNDGRLDLSLSRDSKYEGSYTDDDQKGWLGLMRQLPDGAFESVGIASGINNLASKYSASLTACTGDRDCEGGERCYFAACRQPCTRDSECPQGETGESCGTYFIDALGANQSFCRPEVQGKRAQNHAWSDIDHDGDLDLLVGGRDGGGGRPNFLFRNDVGQDNRWLAVRVKGDGVKVNRDGIGARLKLIAGEGTQARQQMRDVQGSRGMYNGMDGMTQHFGLGDFPCGYRLEVRWPDGTTAAFAPGTFPEGTYLTLTYPDHLSW